MCVVVDLTIGHGKIAENELILGQSSGFIAENILNEAELFMKGKWVAFHTLDVANDIVGNHHLSVTFHVRSVD